MTYTQEKRIDLIRVDTKEATSAATDTLTEITDTLTEITEKFTMKNVLFLAPGYQYAQTVINNLSKELDRKKIPYNVSKNSKDMYVRTSKVNVEIVYMDPVKWTSELFENRDAVFGKKELIAKATHRFFHMFIHTPSMSLSRYIKEVSDIPERTPVDKRTMYIPEITKAYFNDPVTVVLWSDGTKTVVKCQEGDVYSAEVGLALCIAKKSLGNMPNFNNVFRKWIPEDKEPSSVELVFEDSAHKFAQALINKVDEKIRNWRFPRKGDVTFE